MPSDNWDNTTTMFLGMKGLSRLCANLFPSLMNITILSKEKQELKKSLPKKRLISSYKYNQIGYNNIVNQLGSEDSPGK